MPAKATPKKSPAAKKSPSAAKSSASPQASAAATPLVAAASVTPVVALASDPIAAPSPSSLLSRAVNSLPPPRSPSKAADVTVTAGGSKRPRGPSGEREREAADAEADAASEGAAHGGCEGGGKAGVVAVSSATAAANAGAASRRRVGAAKEKDHFATHTAFVAERRAKAEAAEAHAAALVTPYVFPSSDEAKQKNANKSTDNAGEDDDDDYEIVTEKVLIRVPTFDHFADLGFDRQAALLGRCLRFADLETAEPKMYFVVGEEAAAEEKAAAAPETQEEATDSNKDGGGKGKQQQKGGKCSNSKKDRKEAAEEGDSSTSSALPAHGGGGIGVTLASPFISDISEYFTLRSATGNGNGGGGGLIAVTATAEDVSSSGGGLVQRALPPPLAGPLPPVSPLTFMMGSPTGRSVPTGASASSHFPPSSPAAAAAVAAAAKGGPFFGPNCDPNAVRLFRKAAPLPDAALLTAAFVGRWEGAQRRATGLTNEVLCSLVRREAADDAIDALSNLTTNLEKRGGGGKGGDDSDSDDSDNAAGGGGKGGGAIPSVFRKDASYDKKGSSGEPVSAEERRRRRYAGNTLHRQLTTGARAAEEIAGWAVEAVVPVKASITMHRIV